ncbi:hypothetical protein [Cohnella panacarvi]|uniref:hypothetical protein n=1 Tax=Cohnella panacarvi TaxID=400776 RepID=UPI00047D2D8C|nr:hypothetical protein [Cohnella panacarvi]
MSYAFAIEPSGGYTSFSDGEEELDKCREWGLLSEKAAKTKTFAYKRAGQSWTCNVVGYVDSVTAVISFDNGRLHCIHPSYLKEMQAASFGQRGSATDSGGEATTAADEEPQEAAAQATTEAVAAAPVAKPAAAEPAKPQAAKEPAAKGGKKQKLQLPEEKVKMTAIVKEFTTVPNHFTEEDDEVVIYEAVAILEPALEVGDAWSSHSATLKKLELAVGDKLVFDAKIAAKKLLKHPVPYKINNPSKIQKNAEA